MPWQFELIAGPFGGITEGPVWDGYAVLFTNIENSLIYRYCPSTEDLTVVRGDTNNGNGLTLDQDKRLYCCEGGGEGRHAEAIATTSPGRSRAFPQARLPQWARDQQARTERRGKIY